MRLCPAIPPRGYYTADRTACVSVTPDTARAFLHSLYDGAALGDPAGFDMCAAYEAATRLASCVAAHRAWRKAVARQDHAADMQEVAALSILADDMSAAVVYL